MKKPMISGLILILTTFLIIGSLGTSQVKANDGLINKNDYAYQGAEDDIYQNLATYEDAEPYFPYGVPEQINYNDNDMPQAAPGVQRIVFSASDFHPWNSAFWERYTPRGHGCIALRVPDESHDIAHDAEVALPFTVGTKIVGMWITGYDGLVGTNSSLAWSLERHGWGGDVSEFYARGDSPDAEPFNVWTSANNFPVETGYAYYVKLRYFPTWGTLNPDRFKFCQITVEYIPPSPFVLAIPTVNTKP